MPRQPKNSAAATNNPSNSNTNKSSSSGKATTTAGAKQKSDPGKTSTTKTKKSSSEPKRALSAYMFFVRGNREKVKAENPEAKFGEIMKFLGEKWKALNDEEKAPYNEMATNDKKRYADEKTTANNVK
ncbi:20885_t:CDS:2 [Entrophospora sp. SA101]|nr:3381_t:CDS:2 [Entrophospora sp. SA101]CAJ0642344.1 7306_t:CDS:2 [Entrophospora sp. SA101]CAJ0751443.1 9336_t:CDS:2 [Entrophospora sp. SA101]CAJ0761460.1 19452_t:CDS:2 [Entrophospora sp. SA101]CAJ0764159.1 20885_t:CDS:2 [Entrophospora sp. SA101]